MLFYRKINSKEAIMDINLYKQTLKERGWTYRDLARETGISLTNVSRIMAGIVKDPRQSTIELIEKALGINVYFTPEELAAGARTTRRVEITPIEDDLLYTFREIGKRFGAEGQRAALSTLENLLKLK